MGKVTSRSSHPTTTPIVSTSVSSDGFSMYSNEFSIRSSISTSSSRIIASLVTARIRVQIDRKILLTECLYAASIDPVSAQDIGVVSEKCMMNEGDMSRKQLAKCVRTSDGNVRF